MSWSVKTQTHKNRDVTLVSESAVKFQIVLISLNVYLSISQS